MSNALPADWNTLLRLARTEVQRTLAELPEPLREPAATLPVVYETVPSADLAENGIEADTLGLFSGDPIHDEGQSALPAHVTLFLQNIWDFAGYDPEIFRDEVRITYVHELGHYLGLDEDDLDERGLL
jgi:predicted Zn-dependent protease with MMP-like domain